MQLFPYLFFSGNCEEAMNFYKDALGGSINFIQRFGDSPAPCDEDWKQKVMHATMQAAGTTLYFSDSQKDNHQKQGDNVYLSLDFKSETEIDNAFAALSAGGTTTMPLADQFWGAKFGMCTDKFGIHWMFNYDRPKN